MLQTYSKHISLLATSWAYSFIRSSAIKNKGLSLWPPLVKFDMMLYSHCLRCQFLTVETLHDMSECPICTHNIAYSRSKDWFALPKCLWSEQNSSAVVSQIWSMYSCRYVSNTTNYDVNLWFDYIPIRKIRDAESGRLLEQKIARVICASMTMTIVPSVCVHAHRSSNTTLLPKIRKIQKAKRTQYGYQWCGRIYRENSCFLHPFKNASAQSIPCFVLTISARSRQLSSVFVGIKLSV